MPTLPKVPSGQSIPGKTWLRATDALAHYAKAGKAWIVDGRPRLGGVYETFLSAEKEYSEAAEAIWFAQWTEDQRREWAELAGG